MLLSRLVPPDIPGTERRSQPSTVYFSAPNPLKENGLPSPLPPIFSQADLASR
jgi:hypothetical protein